MGYSQLSDQQINMLVAKIEHPDRKIIESMSRPPSVLMLGGINTWFDYCNNPADAWPIILKNRISISAQSEYEGMGWISYSFDSNVDFDVIEPKPFRAAMIVFLLIQDANHANS